MRGTCEDPGVEFKKATDLNHLDLKAAQNQKYCSIEQVMPHLLIHSAQNPLKEKMG